MIAARLEFLLWDLARSAKPDVRFSEGVAYLQGRASSDKRMDPSCCCFSKVRKKAATLTNQILDQKDEEKP